MRADRLVAALLFLQARGRVTAAELAAELEVSERTARRDLEALITSGLPVYAQRGRGGGWRLVGGARTDLTGLTLPEVRALFLAAGASGASPELRSALRKLVHAVPEPLRPHAEAASRARIVDELDRSRIAVTAGGPHHTALERAVLDGVRVELGYARPGEEPHERTVDPLGLVLKAGRWHLVAGTADGLRSFRLGRVTSAAPTGEPVRRPAGFDLAGAWRSLATRPEDRLLAATVTAHAEQDALPLLQRLFGEHLSIGRLLADGRREVEAAGPSVEVLAARLAGLGSRVEVVGPPRARAHLARLGRELVARYGALHEVTTP
ncbi:YafY family protein [Streptomyces sp. WAC08241]|uniref:helix-turn-helix transcriptional regulator n=1 Tax=Streptomyces sp. WAC08241 TaxID=2487421 RepID=UPI000F79EA90|nr:WYL domain-containing protein [Streptomyces sp. WAC08241]RSS38602.1 WYL domain-containing protein [Streptomyces sp. WAC08241]